jgi:hypothetical protein
VFCTTPFQPRPQIMAFVLCGMTLTDVVLSWSLLTCISNWSNCLENLIPRKIIHFHDPNHHNDVVVQLLPSLITAQQFDPKQHRTTTNMVLPPFAKYSRRRDILLLQHVLLIILPSFGHCEEVIPPECQDSIVPGMSRSLRHT